MDFNGLLDDAAEELRELFEDGLEDQYYDFHEAINEIADSHVPVYTRCTLELALSNFDLAIQPPEGGWRGRIDTSGMSAVDAINRNIYDELHMHLQDVYQKLLDEEAEREWEDEDEEEEEDD